MKNMYNKRINFVFRLLLTAAICCAAVCSSAFSLPAMASETGEEVLWSEDYYRAADTSDDLSDAERDEIDAACIEFMKKYHADLSLLALGTDNLEGYTLEETAAGYYEDSNFGYGENRDGWQLVYNLDTNEAVIAAFGAAQDMIPAYYLRTVEESIVQYREKYGVFGIFYATTRYMNNYMENASAGEGEGAEETAVAESAGTAEGEAAEASDPMARVGEGSDMPAWYPVNPGSFPDYHDENAPRVVDVADLFTSDEEATMENRLAELRADLQKDIVIFTDVSAYGLGHDVYSADFYDFNGYGIGDDFEGVVLFICMDPNDRGWWVCCTGEETKALYTEEVANQIDDILYEYMVSGKYYEGVSNWIENFRNLYRNGSPYLDDWASLNLADIARTHNAESPRVIDEIGLFTDSEIARISELAAQLSSKYSMDVVIHTALNSGYMSKSEYSEKYYYWGGYGFGDDYDGISLTIFKLPEHVAFANVYGSGICADKLTEVNRDRLEDRCTNSMGEDHCADAVEAWIGQTDHMMKTGRAPQSRAHWIFWAVVSSLAGMLYGVISLFRAQSTMETPSIAENANAYFVPGSLTMRRVSDTFVNMTTSRRHVPRETRSSGGSSGGGRSSYKSSYSGSSGRSHSGSGRRF